jgi:hypothetical protein
MSTSMQFGPSFMRSPMRRVSADLGHPHAQAPPGGLTPQTPTFSSILSHHDTDGNDGVANEANGHDELEKPFRYTRCVFLEL